MNERQLLWNQAYEEGESSSSWFQKSGGYSAAMIAANANHEDPVIDVGGGASRLVDELLSTGFRNLSVLDLSDTGMAIARNRLGPSATDVTWITADVLAWEPPQRFGVWHDRAVLHFLTEPAEQRQYMETLKRGLQPGGLAVIGTFAEDGPEQCSGLPVHRFSPSDLSSLLRTDFRVIGADRVEHMTPRGTIQPFNWIAARFNGDS